MSRRAAGATFCAIAAFLFGVRYVAAAQVLAGTHPGNISTATFDQPTVRIPIRSLLVYTAA